MVETAELLDRLGEAIANARPRPDAGQRHGRGRGRGPRGHGVRLATRRRPLVRLGAARSRGLRVGGARARARGRSPAAPSVSPTWSPTAPRSPATGWRGAARSARGCGPGWTGASRSPTAGARPRLVLVPSGDAGAPGALAVAARRDHLDDAGPSSADDATRSSRGSTQAGLAARRAAALLDPPRGRPRRSAA